MSKHSSSSAVLGLAAIAALIVGVAFMLTPGPVPEEVQAPRPVLITGDQTSPNGTVLFTLQQIASITFSIATVNWGTGFVNTSLGNQACILDTEGTNNEAKCKNFTTVTQGFIVENDGNINITVNLASNKNRTQFVGGDDDLNAFGWKVSQNESGSCGNLTGPTSYVEVNASSPGTLICNVYSGGVGGFNFIETNDTMRIDINITIPYNVPTGPKNATLTATATSV